VKAIHFAPDQLSQHGRDNSRSAARLSPQCGDNPVLNSLDCVGGADTIFAPSNFADAVGKIRPSPRA